MKIGGWATWKTGEDVPFSDLSDCVSNRLPYPPPQQPSMPYGRFITILYPRSIMNRHHHHHQYLPQHSNNGVHFSSLRRTTGRTFPCRLVVCVGLTLISCQLAVNFYLYLNIYRPEKDPTWIQKIQDLQLELDKLKHDPNLPTPYKHDGRFFPFTIRDAKRLTPVQVSPEFHIFDYVDTTAQNQQASRLQQLWLDGDYIARAPCSQYSILCYKRKILQVLDLLMSNTTAQYFFYVEADNELCVPMEHIRNLTYRHARYFIGTGIGFSGWIMNRTFIEDFLEAYRPSHKANNESPDPIGARLLMEKKAWSVTRQYLVSHTIKQGIGVASLTVGKIDLKTKQVKEVKHLPRCFEPKRTKWLESNTSTEDMHGWDFFDSDDCPPGTELYPCRPDQYVNVTFGVKDMLKPLNATNALRINGTMNRRPSETWRKGHPLLGSGESINKAVQQLKARRAAIADAS
jgi:hypothetical protein